MESKSTFAFSFLQEWPLIGSKGREWPFDKSIFMPDGTQRAQLRQLHRDRLSAAGSVTVCANDKGTFFYNCWEEPDRPDIPAKCK